MGRIEGEEREREGKRGPERGKGEAGRKRAGQGRVEASKREAGKIFPKAHNSAPNAPIRDK